MRSDEAAAILQPVDDMEDNPQATLKQESSWGNYDSNGPQKPIRSMQTLTKTQLQQRSCFAAHDKAGAFV